MMRHPNPPIWARAIRPFPTALPLGSRSWLSAATVHRLLWLVAAWLAGCATPTEPEATASSALLNSATSQRTDVVGILADRGLDEQLCTGVALLPNLVLTARHCTTLDRAALADADCTTAIIGPTPKGASLRVMPGRDVDLVMEDQQRSVREIWLNADQGKLCGEDLALLYLSSETADSSTIASGDLAAATRLVPDPGAQFVAVGYGLNDGDWGRQRQNSSAVITCRGAECSDPRLTHDEFLAASGACEGDSGGPAFDDAGRLFAVASRSSLSCAETAYLTFDGHWAWLTGAVRQAAVLGQFPVPEWAASASSGTDPVIVSAPSNSEKRIAGGCSVTTRRVGASDEWVTGLVGVLFGAAVLARRRKRGRGRYPLLAHSQSSPSWIAE